MGKRSPLTNTTHLAWLVGAQPECLSAPEGKKNKGHQEAGWGAGLPQGFSDLTVHVNCWRGLLTRRF